MRQELKNAFGRVFLTIDVDKVNRWVHVDWRGYLTSDNIQAGAKAYTAALEEAGYNCVLNDTRLVLGTWAHSLDWVLNDWAPNAAKSGLEYFAMITARETFAESTASDFYSNLTAFKAEVFEDLEDARKWLRQFSLANEQ